MNTPVKISIVEPSEIIRGGVMAVLRRIHDLHFEVFEVAQPSQMRASLAWQKPDIVIFNTAICGLSAIAQVKKEIDRTIRFVALQTSLTDPALLQQFDETVSLYDSVEQIRDKFMRLVESGGEDTRHESLSPREKEVIVCVIKGMTNKQIADELCLSTHTVITHRRNISAKLGIHSAAGLTIYAIVNKLVELDDVKTSVGELHE